MCFYTANEIAHDLSIPLLYVFADGPEIQVGPMVYPGETATAKLIAAINEKRQPEGEVLDTRYIPRMSTAHHLNEATP